MDFKLGGIMDEDGVGIAEYIEFRLPSAQPDSYE